MKYRFENTGPQARVIYSAAGAAVHIPPGGMAEVEMDPRAMRWNTRGPMKATPLSEIEDEVREPESPAPPANGQTDPADFAEPDPPELPSGDNESPAAVLLKAAEEGLSYETLSSEARTILGDDMPKGPGRPARATIVAALEQAAAPPG